MLTKAARAALGAQQHAAGVADGGFDPSAPSVTSLSPSAPSVVLKVAERVERTLRLTEAAVSTAGKRVSASATESLEMLAVRDTSTTLSAVAAGRRSASSGSPSGAALPPQRRRIADAADTVDAADAVGVSAWLGASRWRHRPVLPKMSDSDNYF